MPRGFTNFFSLIYRRIGWISIVIILKCVIIKVYEILVINKGGLMKKLCRIIKVVVVNANVIYFVREGQNPLSKDSPNLLPKGFPNLLQFIELYF